MIAQPPARTPKSTDTVRHTTTLMEADLRRTAVGGAF
jgi:hypothetical protein